MLRPIYEFIPLGKFIDGLNGRSVLSGIVEVSASINVDRKRSIRR